MATIGNHFGAKKGQLFFHCNPCDYKCSKKYCWERHLLTAKHIKATSATNLGQKGATHFCTHCGKEYFNRSGLWRHSKKCIVDNLTDTQKQHELIDYLLKENTEFKQLMIEQNKHMIELAKNASQYNIHNTTNTIHNNQFNLQFFLNETCKNAMNIMDFVSQLQVGISDLEETGRLGFAEGISKIFINGLKQIKVSDRPIHCSDTKREILYIKDNNLWNKESEDKTLLTNAIKHVANKNIRQIFEWTKEHPEYNDPSSKENDKYLKIVSESMCGSTQEETNKNYNKIIKNIVKETVIEK
jgi:hypothetical protein